MSLAGSGQQQKEQKAFEQGKAFENARAQLGEGTKTNQPSPTEHEEMVKYFLEKARAERDQKDRELAEKMAREAEAKKQRRRNSKRRLRKGQEKMQKTGQRRKPYTVKGKSWR